MKDYRTQYQLWKYRLDHPLFLWYDVCMAMVSSGLDWSGRISLVWSNIYRSKVVSSCLVWFRPSCLVQSGVVLSSLILSDVVWKQDFKWALTIWTILRMRQFWQSDDKQMNDDNHVIQEQACQNQSKGIIWQFYIHVRVADGTPDRNYCISHVVCDLSCVVCGMWLVICHQFPK